MAREFPTGTFESWADCAEFLPHFTKVMEYNQTDKNSELNKVIVACRTVVNLVQKGHYTEAERLVKAALEIHTRWLGRRDPLSLNLLEVLLGSWVVRESTKRQNSK